MQKDSTEYEIDRFTDSLGTDADRAAILRVRRGRARVHLRRGELAALIERMAGSLHAHGVGEGDTVALAVVPGPRALAVVFAAIRLRARVALVDPRVGPDVLLAQLEVASPVVVVADNIVRLASGPGALLARRFGLNVPRLDRIARVLTLGPRLPGAPPALEVAGAGSRAIPDRRGADADALVIFTSGTTSEPRAVVHTVSSISGAVGAAAALFKPEAGSRVLGGTFFVMVPALLAGAAVASPGRRTSTIAARLEAVKPETTYFTPPQARQVLARGTPVTGRVLCGSAPVSASLLQRLRVAGAREAWGVYAMTEAFPVAAVEATEKSAYARESGPGEPDLLGRVVDGMEVRVDPTGQLLVRGVGMASRYLGQQPFDWVPSGDRGVVEDGRVLLTGRLKEMILRRAMNIYPGLYEPSLHVEGVEGALLVGVPSDDGDERVALLIEAATGQAQNDVVHRLKPIIERMGHARPDFVVFAKIPTSGRSRKPDRLRAAELAHAANGNAGTIWTP